VDIVELDVADARVQKAYYAYIILNSKPKVIVTCMTAAIPLYLAVILAAAYYFDVRTPYFVSLTDSVQYSTLIGIGIAGTICMIFNCRMVYKLRKSRPDGKSYSIMPKTAYIIASAPEQTVGGNPAQRKIVEISNRRLDMMFGFDWKGSSTEDSRDADVNWSSAKHVLESYW
jgi:hypothetical protein